MNAERWQRVKLLFSRALDYSVAKRISVIVKSDETPSVIAEARKLLSRDARAGSFLVSSGTATAESLFASPVSAGETIGGHFRITSELGRGGMGVVYRAEDLILSRPVALKFLRGDEDASTSTARVREEARAAARLNHPNICVIYETGEHHGQPYIVMELLEGKTLKQRIGPEGLPLPRLLDWAAQIADGLKAAHNAGVIHRDIKPANIFITAQEKIKILDFGLAGLSVPLIRSDSPTQLALTSPGLAAGTAPYMSPEQIRGKQLDSRTDLFSFGAVLYEMATGTRAFRGKTISAVISEVLQAVPPSATRLKPSLPPAVESIASKALEKDRSVRYQSAAEMLADLNAVGAVPEPPLQRQRLVPAAVALLAVATVAVYFYLHQRQAHRLTEKDTVVLADFTNTTGDPVFDGTLRQGLSAQLEQSPFLNLLSDTRIAQTLTLMSRPKDARLTQELAREVCQRTASTATIEGSIGSLGSQYVLGLKAVYCQTGDTLAEEQVTANGKEKVLGALGDAATKVRQKLGESLSSVERYGTPLDEATTPSLEALKAYSLGRKTVIAKGNTAALPFYKRAVELDPNFAMAYRAMGSLYTNLNEVGRAAENGRKAFDLREKVSERERLNIEADYYFLTTGELEKAAQAYELWQQTYPGDYTAVLHLGNVSTALGNYEKALDEAREAMRLDPDTPYSYINLAEDYISLNRLEEAEAVFKQAKERKTKTDMLYDRYVLAFLKGDIAQMTRLTTGAMGKPDAEDALLSEQADTEAWYGKLEMARELTWRAMDSAQHNDAKETAAGYQVLAGLREVESGNLEQARANVNAAVNLAPNRDVRAIAALVLARAGDTAAAEKLVAELDKAFPLDTLVQRYWLPTIRAGVALQRKDPRRAIELMHASSSIELGSPTGLNVYLCPVYLRGKAYLMLHDGNAAAAEFQKFIDHRGVVTNFPWGALARLGLARAYGLQGDTTKARTAYQDFLTLWKDADPDVPIYKQAKAEYAKLQ